MILRAGIDRWPHGSHWQEPVKPFVEQREFNLAGIGRTGKGSSMHDRDLGLTHLLPMFHSRASIPRIFHQVKFSANPKEACSNPGDRGLFS